MSAENIINNPPKEFTEPCEACGVSEFQLGVKHAEERIIKLIEEQIHRFSWAIEQGAKRERERIAATLEIEAERHQQLLLIASAEYLLGLSRAIKGENK